MLEGVTIGSQVFGRFYIISEQNFELQGSGVKGEVVVKLNDFIVYRGMATTDVDEWMAIAVTLKLVLMLILSLSLYLCRCCC
jgi:hypothetical protein